MNKADKKKWYQKGYYQKHKERLKLQQKKYYQGHKKEVCAYQKKYRSENRNKIRKYQKVYGKAHIERYKELDRERYKKDPTKYRQTRIGYKTKYRFRHKYNMSVEDYNKMYSAQDGKCAICKKEFTKLGVDHDHGSGYIRGLLCHKCNSGIGFLEENLVFLEGAIQYLLRNSGGEQQ
jgi:hypothetical protein